MFEILKKSKIARRLDRSDNFWKQFGIYDENTKKVMGLYEIENIDNPNIWTIAINPKEYFEKSKTRQINKKHKGVRRDTPGMNFESYAEKISTIRQIGIARNYKKLAQKRLQVKTTNMAMTSINKVKFASINDKRYYGSDGILSLPFGHHLLNEVRQYKKPLPKIHIVIEKEKDKILKLENAFSKNERLRVLRSIYSQPITYCKLNEKNTLKIKSVEQTTKHDYILNSKFNEIHYGKFVGNILIVGRTACGKTFFTPKIAVNNFFG